MRRKQLTATLLVATIVCLFDWRNYANARNCFDPTVAPGTVPTPTDQRYHITGSPHALDLPFSFTVFPDFSACTSFYSSMSYTVSVEGGPMPDWITLNSGTPKVTINTVNTLDYNGMFTVVINGILNSVPTTNSVPHI